MRAVSLLLTLALLLPPCPAPARGEEGMEASGWLTYWNAMSALDEVYHAPDAMDALVYFAAYFDDTNSVFVPEELHVLIEGTRYIYGGDELPARYVSVTNDILLSDGTSIQKDVPLLHSLLGTEQSRRAHANELARLGRSLSLDGLEIDYEAIREDSALWANFLSFIEILWTRCAEEGLLLRVVLEPGIPFDSLDFPSGPRYVVMCYNLHGNHSGPGPKADLAFLEGMAARTDSLPKPVTFALAGGGYAWHADGTVTEVSGAEARHIAQANGITPQRDEDSAAAHFTYTDEAGASHEIWYGDSETIKAWTRTLSARGASATCLWQLGGN